MCKNYIDFSIFGDRASFSEKAEAKAKAKEEAKARKAARAALRREEETTAGEIPALVERLEQVHKLGKCPNAHLFALLTAGGRAGCGREARRSDKGEEGEEGGGEDLAANAAGGRGR